MNTHTHQRQFKRSRRKVSGFLPCACALLSAMPWSWAADAPTSSPSSALLRSLSLEELMQTRVTTQSTLSRVDEKIDDAPGSVYVITRKMIQERGYRSLGELLQTVPGFTVFHRDLDFVTGVRGLNANDNEKISLLVNGQILLGIHENQGVLNGPINLDNVERVEVVVGPSSFFQQANTLAGTVNVITKDVDGVELIGAAGNDLKYSSTLMMGHHWAPDKFLSLSFTTEAKRGFDAWNRDFHPGLAGRTVTGELDWPSFFGVAKAQYGELSAQFVARKSTFPELHIENSDPKQGGTNTDAIYSVLLKDEHPWSDTLTSVAKFDASLKEYTRLSNDGRPPADAAQLSWKQWAYTTELGLRYTGFEHHVIQAGFQGSYDYNFDSFITFNSPDAPGGVGNKPNQFIPKTTIVDKNAFGVGFYVDDTIQATKWLKLIGGVRVDENSKLEGDRWFPGARAAIIVDPTANWVSKLIYNRSVRMPSDPTALDLLGRQNPRSPFFAGTSLPASEPEILETFELQEIFYLGRVRVGASVYHQELSNFISFFRPWSNGGNFRGEGVELSIQAPLSPKFAIWANGAWDDSTLHLFNPSVFGPATGQTEGSHAFVNSENRIIGSAGYVANLGFDWKILDHLTFSPSARYFTEQAGIEFHPADQGGVVFKTIRNRFYLDAGLTWDHVGGRDMDLRLSGHNLLNNREPVASQIETSTMRPRGIEGVLTIDFRF